MKREHFDRLWEQCDSGCLGPPFQPVPKKVWRDLVAKGIVGAMEIPDKVYPFDPDNEYGERERRCFCSTAPGHPWQISGFSPEELDRLHSEGKISICSIEVEALASLTAEQWGIRPVFWEPDLKSMFGGTYVIGWKDKDTGVAITDFGSKDGSLVDFLWGIRDTIDEEIQEMFEEGIFEEPDEENQENTDQPCPWACRYLYVIGVGSSYDRSVETQRQLADSGITCLGTEDFLTEEGQPKWDAQVRPRSILSFSEASKEFRCDGEPLELTPTQTTILMVLWQNGDRITSFEELFKAVWPPRRKVKSRRGAKRGSKPEWPDETLYTHISSLNKKLRKTGKVSIECIRGKGYKLVWHRQKAVTD